MNNLRLKLLSLLIAGFFWYFVTTNVSTLTLAVPIEIRNAPEAKVLLSAVAAQAQVKVSGPTFMVSSLAASPPAFKVKVPPDTQNRYVQVLKGEDLDLPPAIQVLGIEPREVELSFDDKVTREVPVEVPQIGVLDESLKLESIVVDPSRVVVTGPRTQLQRVTRVETYPVDLREIKGDTRQELPLRKPGPSLALSHELVLARLRVSPVQSSRKFRQLPVEIRSLDGAQFTLHPRGVDVEVAGPRSLLELLQKEQIIPYARLVRPPMPGERVKVSVEVPKAVTVLSTEPVEVSVVTATPAPTALSTAAPRAAKTPQPPKRR